MTSKYMLDVQHCFKNYQTMYQKRSYDKRKAGTVASNLIRDFQDLPLTWDTLTKVELIGVIEEEPIEVNFYFGTGVVRVTMVVVDKETLGIVASGTNYGALVF
jgi:hypothetical protein